MKTKIIFSSLTTLIAILLISCSSETQQIEQTTNLISDAKVEVIQFHSERRCMTCNNIESYTKETLKTYPSISFSLVNVDDTKNANMAEQFEAAGTALYLYSPSSGKKKDLTDFAFMNAGNKDKFIEGLKKEIDVFLNS